MFNILPKKVPLYPDEKPQGMEDVWVTIVPPTFREQEELDDVIRFSYSVSGEYRPLHSQADVLFYKILLTFGGSNLEVSVPKRDKDGHIVYEDENEVEIAMETLTFGAKTSRKDLMERLRKLPPEVIREWAARVEEVVPQWVTLF